MAQFFAAMKLLTEGEAPPEIPDDFLAAFPQGLRYQAVRGMLGMMMEEFKDQLGAA
jgi:hypothetical protein